LDLTRTNMKIRVLLQLCIFGYFVGIQSFLLGQSIYGVSSYWNDSFKEWIILAPEEEDDGKLQMMWELRNDWTEWEFEYMGMRGRIEQPNDRQPEYWELKSGYQTVTMRTQWPGDFSEWRIASDSITLVIKTRYNQIADEWVIDDSKYGDFYMYTEWEGDARDWLIKDFLAEEVSLLMKIAIVHIVLLQSVPRI